MGLVYAGGDPGEEVSGAIIRAKRNRVNGRKLVGLRQWMGTVQAHHSFVDGIHIGQFADKLQKYLDEL